MKIYPSILLVFFGFAFSQCAFLHAQFRYEGLCCPNPPGQEQVTSMDIFEDIQRLQFLGSVLHIAAHPDDENSALLAYLSNHVKAETAYLSLTRGDGGQNLIGSELRELLGVIRTQELLAARKIDGAEQYFSRANDFGYSKTAEETLDIWDEKLLLEDIVWVIRQFRPDVIINRFDHRTSGSTHGHHTASAILSQKAFSLAGNTKAYPQQLAQVAPHRPERLLYNSVFDEQEAYEKKGPSRLAKIDISVFYPGHGRTNEDMAAASRSQHRCQGMGTAPGKGPQIEYLELLEGPSLSQNADMFVGINTSWSRVPGGERIGQLLKTIEANFDFTAPHKSVPALVEAWSAIQQLSESHWKSRKSEALKKTILDCLALQLDVTAPAATYTPGTTLPLQMELINRSPFPVLLNSVGINDTVFATNIQQNIYNKPVQHHFQYQLPHFIEPDNPYWLTEEAQSGMYEVTDPMLRGRPESPDRLQVTVKLEIEGVLLEYRYPVVHKFTDPVMGEIFQTVNITPPVSVKTANEVYIFPDNGVRIISLSVTAHKNDLVGVLYPGQARGWTCKPDSVDFALSQKGMSQTFEFELTPPSHQEEAEIRPFVRTKGIRYDRALYDIQYQHIPRQLVALPAKSKTVRIDLEMRGNHIAYLMGAGDVVPEQLRQIGYKLDQIKVTDLQPGTLQRYDALILGIRAHNVWKELAFRQNAILEYAEAGGTVIVQYNTNHRLLTPQPGPYPMTLSKDRVTQEDASVTLLLPEHPLLNFPNKITTKDFDGWVQERGLYFPNKWDDRYQILISCHDSGGTPLSSGLLYTPYGKGHFIYTGYSFFRQLPAGVPGAFRLFANLISVGKEVGP